MNIKEEDFEQILSAHLQKEQKVNIYKPRVEANLINGFVNFKATWSWWAFFGTWAFFLYRKMYLVSAIFFILTVAISSSGFGNLILMLASGVSGFYFYTKKLDNDLKIAGYEQRDFSEVLNSLKQLGGYHQWVIWLAVILNIIILLFSLMTIGILASSY